jgi:hypothetical protein
MALKASPPHLPHSAEKPPQSASVSVTVKSQPVNPVLVSEWQTTGWNGMECDGGSMTLRMCILAWQDCHGLTGLVRGMPIARHLSTSRVFLP